MFRVLVQMSYVKQLRKTIFVMVLLNPIARLESSWAVHTIQICSPILFCVAAFGYTVGAIFLLWARSYTHCVQQPLAQQRLARNPVPVAAPKLPAPSFSSEGRTFCNWQEFKNPAFNTSTCSVFKMARKMISLEKKHLGGAYDYSFHSPWYKNLIWDCCWYTDK
jgi:hypothetical protein